MTIDYFAGRPEARTSYSNQRQLAARDLGGNTRCVHDASLTDGCTVCRMSGSILLPA